MKKAVVLLSAGLDSTVNLYRAQKELVVCCVLSFDYGQKAASSELRQAAHICKKLNLNHQIVKLDWLKALGHSGLTGQSENIPTGARVSLDDGVRARASMKAVWVPNRNGIFLNVAAAYAEHFEAAYVIPGFNIEEAETFSDNSLEFMQAIDESFFYSTQNKVTAKCFTTSLNKTEIVAMGLELGVDMQELWPCYFDGPKICGECESCQRFLRALNQTGVAYNEV